MARGGRMSGGLPGAWSNTTKDPRLAPGGGRMTREAMQEKNRAAREGLEASVAAKKAEAPARPGMNARIEAMPSVRGLNDVPREKAGRMAEVYRNTSNRLGATGDTAQAQRYAQRAEVLGKIATGKPVQETPPVKMAQDSPAKRITEALTKAGVKTADQAHDLLSRNMHTREGLAAPTPGQTLADYVANNATRVSTADMYGTVREQMPKAEAKPKAGKSLTPAGSIEKLGMAELKAMAAQHGVAPARSKQQTIARIKAAQASGVTAQPKAPAPAPAPKATATLDIGARVTAAAKAAPPVPVAAAPPAPLRLPAPAAPSAPTNDTHMGTAPVKPSNPLAPAAPSTAGRTYGRAMTGLTGVAAAAQGAHAYSDAREHGKGVGEAAFEGMKAAAPSAALMAAPAIAPRTHAIGNSLLGISKDLLSHGPGMGEFMLDFPTMKIGLAAGAVGGAAKGIGIAAQVAGKVALPAAMAYGAYQGAKEDSSTVRGIGRGLVRSVDPTGIVTGLTGHGAGLGERIYDAAFGKAQARFEQTATPKPETSGVKGTRNINNLKAIIANKQARAQQKAGD